MSGPPNLGSS